MDGCLWYFQLFDFESMCSCGFLTWFWCLRLEHGPFFAPLVTFKSCHTGAYPPSFYLVGGVIHFLFIGVFWCHTKAHPLSFVMIDGFDFSLIWFIYWHFSDATLGHTPLFHGAITFHFLSFQWLSSIVPGSPSHFGGSLASCSDPLVISMALQYCAQIP